MITKIIPPKAGARLSTAGRKPVKVPIPVLCRIEQPILLRSTFLPLFIYLTAIHFKYPKMASEPQGKRLVTHFFLIKTVPTEDV